MTGVSMAGVFVAGVFVTFERLPKNGHEGYYVDICFQVEEPNCTPPCPHGYSSVGTVH